MVHKLLSIPLTDELFDKEFQHIQMLASFNGYKPSIISRMLKKKKNKLNITNSTTLTPIEIEVLSRVPIAYESKTSQGFKNSFKKINLAIVNKNSNKLCNLLGSTKDKLKQEYKS